MMSDIFKRFNLVIIFIVWRLILFVPLLIAIFFIIPNITKDFTYIYTPLSYTFSFNSVFLLPWANFDGIHYLNIAQYNYINQARFFPLLPIFINVLSRPFLSIFNSHLTHFFTGFLFANLVFVWALLIFKKLIELDFSKEISKKSILNLLIFPTSFFFVAIYSEGLFLLLTLLSFYFARKNKWALSIICAMLLMVTRFVGVAILPALLYEFVRTKGIKNRRIALFLFAPLGLAVYSLFNYYKWHNFLYFIKAQGELGNNRSVDSIVLFPQTIYRYIKILSTVSIQSLEWSIALLELSSFLFAAFLLYFAWKKKVRTSYLIFTLINFIVATATGTFSALPRYVITLFPVFLALALIENKLIKIVYYLLSPVLLFILLMLFARGYYIA